MEQGSLLGQAPVIQPLLNAPSCTSCHLHKTARSVCVKSRGSDRPIILFVGEGPGKTEDLLGDSFRGKAGQKLDDLMQRAGLDPALCRWSNLVKCIPWQVYGQAVRAPESSESEVCASRFLEPEILQTNPIFIVPLGAAAASYFYAKDVKLTQVRGRRSVVNLPTVHFRYYRMMRWVFNKKIDDGKLIQTAPAGKEKAIARAIAEYGFRDLDVRPFTVFPTWHPAAILWGNKDAETDLLNDLNYLAGRLSGQATTGDYEILTNVHDVVGVINRLLGEYREGKFPFSGYDVETTSLNYMDPKERLCTFAIGAYKGKTYTIPWDHHESPFKGDMLAQMAIRGAFNKFLEEVPIVNHTLKFDVEFSIPRGILIRKILDDTELMSWTLFNDQEAHDLDTLTSKYTSLKLPKQEMRELQAMMPKAEKYNMDNYDLDIVGRYNGGDVDSSAFHLYPALRGMMEAQGLHHAHDFYVRQVLMPTISMEVNGVPVDLSLRDTLDKELRTSMDQYMDVLRGYGYVELMERLINPDETKKRKKFNINSPEQLSMLLFGVMEFPASKMGKKRKNGKQFGSTDKHVLKSLLEKSNEEMNKVADKESNQYLLWKVRYDIIKAVQEWKRLSKQHSGYVKNIHKHIWADNFIRSSFGIRHTESGRFNSVDPSLHTIPWHSPVKKMFVSRFVNGVILSADHAQMELRVFAMATGDEQLIQAFVEGRDIHRLIASRVMGVAEKDVLSDDRRRIKTVVFGLLYGRGPKSIAAQEGISPDRAKEIIEGVFKQFPKIRNFIKEIHAFVQRNGYVNYINGFRRLLAHDSHDREALARVQRQAVNTCIQGPASDLAVLGMINMYKTMARLRMHSIHWEFKHDDLCYDIAPGELLVMMHMIQKEMVQRPKQQVPFIGTVPLQVDFELGINWGQLVEAELVGNDMIEVSGEEEHVKPLLDRLARWEDSPRIVHQEVEVKKKTAIVRSLMKSTGETVDYNHVTTRMQFLNTAFNFTSRKPTYAHKPFMTMNGVFTEEALPVAV